MPFTKESLKKEFTKDWKKHYQLEIFKERGFRRKRCPQCGKNFWTLDEDRKLCGDPPCESYGFLGMPITKKKWDYIEAWRQFESFFRKNGHDSVPRYPVIDRWRPDLYFTMASIQDFQRLDKGNMVFEFPSNPLVVPQMCLRFNDIPNVGVTGRHHTSFIMGGQHSFGDYWKDRCIELNFNFLTKSMGIPEKELTYTEDLWAMPDFSAFGPSMETFSKGLEIVNSVFMQFTKKGTSFRELPMKVIDVGWGHERIAWFTTGTYTGYDTTFGPVISWMKKQAGLHQNDLFDEYSKFAGHLNVDEVKNIEKIRKDIAKKLGVDARELNSVVEPMQALYAIADHAKTLLFAVTDGGIPSNVGGGYNLRVLLRRAFSFMKDFEFSFTLPKVAELHAKHLYPLFPELMGGREILSKIMGIEKDRYEKTLEKTGILIRTELNKGKLDTKKMIQLYVSNGINPELIEKVAKEQGHDFSVPTDFYIKLTDAHMTGEKEKEKGHLKVSTHGIQETRMLYYDEPYQKEFDAHVVAKKKVGKDVWLVLDKTLFYPEGWGQPFDQGILSMGAEEFKVSSVQKLEGIVFHRIDNPEKIKKGDIVHGRIDWEKRYILMKMHSATHLVAGAARKVIGPHIWQAGANKGFERSRIDLTHYKPFTQEEIVQIERVANDVVKKEMPIKSQVLSRKEAEKKYGFVLYQGGASPGKDVRVIDTANGFDVEACGGTHLKNTGEIDLIKIMRTERIQDGVNRIEFAAGDPAFDFITENESIIKKILHSVSRLGLYESVAHSLQTEEDASYDVMSAASVFSVEPKTLLNTFQRFVDEIRKDHDDLNRIRREMGTPEKILSTETFFRNAPRISSLRTLAENIFHVWKEQKKEIDSQKESLARVKASKLISKSRKGRLMDIIKGERSDLIKTASEIVEKNPDVTVILSNQVGDLVVMSRRENAGDVLKEIVEKAGGSGGGKGDLAQGRVDVSKFVKLLG